MEAKISIQSLFTVGAKVDILSTRIYSEDSQVGNKITQGVSLELGVGPMAPLKLEAGREAEDAELGYFIIDPRYRKTMSESTTGITSDTDTISFAGGLGIGGKMDISIQESIDFLLGLEVRSRGGSEAHLMIRSGRTIKKPISHNLSHNLLIVSDQILISFFDAIVVIILFIAGLALIIGDRPKVIGIIGIILIATAGLYSLLKNVLFRSIGCILKRSCYVQEQDNGKLPLKLRILIHNIVSVSPFIGLLTFRDFPYVFRFIVLIYLINLVGYITNSKRAIDFWLKLSVVEKHDDL